jgi:hypothetical protein
VTVSLLASVTQIVGAILVLSAYLLAQVGKLDPHARTYLLLNAAGATILALLAMDGQQWGFLLLEGVWAVASIVALGQRLIILRGPPALSAARSTADKETTAPR